MNTELVSTLIKLVIGSACVMGVIALACILTPRIAAWLIKKFPRLADKPAEKTEESLGGEPTVKGPYDAQREDYDLNYKIYNKDIYGVDFLNGKQKHKKD